MWWCAKCLIKCFTVTSAGLYLIKFELPVLSSKKPLRTAGHRSLQLDSPRPKQYFPGKILIFQRIFLPFCFSHHGNQSDPMPVGPHNAAHPGDVPRMSLRCWGSSSCADSHPREKYPGESGFLVAERPLPSTPMSLSSWLPAKENPNNSREKPQVLSQNALFKHLPCLFPRVFKDKYFPILCVGWGQPEMVNPVNI